MTLLEKFLAENAFATERTYSKRLNIGFQPDSYADFGHHGDFEELFKKFTRHDSYRGMDVSRLWCFILNLKHVLYKARVDGCLAELGVYKGHSSAVIGHFAREAGRKMFLLDTFTGFAREQIEDKLSDNAKGAFRDTSLEYAQETVGMSDLFRWIVGPFPDSVTPELEAEKFAFVSLDCDLFEPTLAGLNFFYSRLQPGGLIFVHDYSSGHWPGATKAVDEFTSATGVGHVLLSDKSGSVVIAKSK